MVIVIYVFDTQYNVFNLWAKELKRCFEEREHEVILLDISGDDYNQALVDLVSSKTIDLFIGYNGIGSDFNVENDSLYDLLKSNYLALFVDHPVYNISRLSQNIKKYIALFNDRSYINYTEKLFPNKHVVKAFMPPSTSQDNSFFNSFSEYQAYKDIDVLFTGTAMNITTKSWEQFESPITKRLDNIIDLLLNDELLSLGSALEKVFEIDEIDFSTEMYLQYSNLLVEVIAYVRAHKRYHMMEALCKSGLEIMVYGNGWESFAEKYANFNYQGLGTSEETIDLSRRTKIVINHNSNHNQGGHDRVFSAICNGAVVFSDHSTYYDDKYIDEESILYYSMSTIDKDINKIKQYLSDDQLRFKLAKNAYQVYLDNDTWKHRANLIEEVSQYANLLK